MATVKTFIKDGFRHFQCDDEESCLRLSFLIKDAGYGFKMSSSWTKKYTEFKIIAAEKDPMEDPKVIKGAKGLKINLQESKGKMASASGRNVMKKQAGAEGFVDYGHGTNANRVFQELRQEAQYEHGSRGYTGTIAEKDGFTMATREVMSQRQAQEYADEHYDDYGKWDDAGCVAFGEEKVVSEKEFEVKVKARNEEEAKKMVQEKMMGGRSRAGAVIEVEIPWSGGVSLTTPAGKRKITTDKPNGEVFYIRSSNTNKKYSTKREAVASTKELLEGRNNIDPGQVVRILKVQDQGGMSYAESSKLATYTVRGKRIQKKVGKVKGYYFFGFASS